MAGPQENMVLRTIYLPKALDKRLRELAFSMEKTKGELMRDLIQDALTAQEGQTLASGAVSITTRSKVRVVAEPEVAPAKKELAAAG